jgi:hypothetical protein
MLEAYRDSHLNDRIIARCGEYTSVVAHSKNVSNFNGE